jgi:GNAT superfamily N-acetyltransferase
LRAWTDDDAGIDREISDAIYPEYREDPQHPAWFPARQLGAPSEYSSRYVVVDTAAGQAIAYATLWELRPRRYRFDLAVRPEYQGRGLGADLLDRLTNDARTLGASGLQARVRDDQQIALDFVCRRGFQESHRMGAYRIDFAHADLSDFDKAFARLRDLGVEVTNLAAVREHDSHYREEFYGLYSAAREGWPDPDPSTAPAAPTSFEIVHGWLNEIRLPEAFFIARLGRRYIAFTSVFDIGTGVHPEFRRKRIATQLKAGSLADAHRRSYHGQTTSTASPAMRAVLLRLGYKHLSSEVRLIRNMA